MDSPEFVFSTVHPTTHEPRARYCIFRSLWAELPDNSRNPATRNERLYESDLLCFTTDKRMSKVGELCGVEGLVNGSGGGGICEAVFWIKGDVMVQWRIKGKAYVIGQDIDSEGGNVVKKELMKRMRVVGDESKQEGWSWGRELTGHFGNMSPGMRASFANPPPGQLVNEPYDDKHLKLGGQVEDLDDAVARANFRVVVIKPTVVESVDLKDPESARRHVYRFDDSTGVWSHEERWP
ncbi:uncharacterized protein RCC_10921 [Ramularia collo-cygni]|uniref:Pyridoxamine 5'-phosphate oxidase Alr4036 family FMN-binding domain-containing protein n=1 Tax=Ramularia collo-cygni TaxID=112498 RepID=A0A2D3VIG5_9PEZI|nr:uncharacterized protein RCC_10921 [Ramularia collo-cygni]CZT25192.1 uncharacterized protein RCC_10921 [Ramularia collo-cygni]